MSGGLSLGLGLGLRYGSGVPPGPPPTPQPQIVVIDFAGVTGIDFSAGGVGDAFVIPWKLAFPSPNAGIWFAPTGFETAPDFSAYDVGTNIFEVNGFSAISSPSDIAAAMAAINFSPTVAAAQINGGSTGSAVQLTSPINASLPDPTNINLPAGVTLTVTQHGHS